MREILFRGKDIAGSWHYGVPLVLTEDFVCIIAPHTFNKKVEASTIGQCTGYEIDYIKVFENDIAKVHLEIPYLPHQDKAIDDIGVVCFDTEDLRYYVVSNTGKKYALCYIKEIVGNIHDNPELLGGADRKEDEGK